MQGSKIQLVIDGSLSRRLSSSLRELLLFRSTILAFAERDIRDLVANPESGPVLDVVVGDP